MDNIQNTMNNNSSLIKPIVFNPILIFIIIFVVGIFIFFSFSLGNKENQNIEIGGEDESGSSYTKIIGIILLCIFILLIIINAFQYFLGINIITSIKNTFTNKPELDIDIYTNVPSSLPPPEENTYEESEEITYTNKPQVFNIPDNIYNYEDAKAVCSAFNSKLATYDQMEEYYKDGGEFCNYGWSDGQMALFPTQKSTYNTLSKIPGHKHDCGRPGINGGYISNPLVRFGANCYGYKPTLTPQEEEIMATIPVYPLTKKDLAFEKRVEYWKGKLEDIIVSPFNKTQWSE
jgi:hypothetical protein